jgi:hypothetical protein
MQKDTIKQTFQTQLRAYHKNTNFGITVIKHLPPSNIVIQNITISKCLKDIRFYQMKNRLSKLHKIDFNTSFPEDGQLS